MSLFSMWATDFVRFIYRPTVVGAYTDF